MVFTVCNIYHFFCAKSFITNEKQLIFYCAVAIFGFILLLMLSEAQPRYKCVFYPLLSILVADGIDFTKKTFHALKIFVKKKHMESKGV